ncbi:MAG TPA: F0F1 ATP synthase subunit gamma [Alphaproteobacteria bacterium]|nr:F0F1 ATP synthase subunit gamma [Alphaproteobacteria bacterium]USO05843.1 MAG: F0F1 ATP synthase subunit gamma [Rhodospirillales bacterium]HOO82447.1 F0F1 ATP synthase subunit gamma [Alphaproteobacteria bacterium]
MPSLRDYRDRIASVKSTRKITSAMKMVAASKLRKAQEQAEASQPYAQCMADMMARVAGGVVVSDASSPLLAGTGSDQKHLLVIVTADRGLCGGFNGNLVKKARAKIKELQDMGKDVSIVCVGRKGRDLLRSDFGKKIEQKFIGVTGASKVEFADASKVTEYVLERFDAGGFDVCHLVYNEFVSVLTQKPSVQQIIPFALPESEGVEKAPKKAGKTKEGLSSPYDFEPEEEQILNALLPRNIGVQIFRSLLDSSAGEQAARMTAMDNATRNAGEMIDSLTLAYNRARQAYITKELIEIISGAEAV